MGSECNRKLNMSKKISGPYLLRVVSSYMDFIVYYLFIAPIVLTFDMSHPRKRVLNCRQKVVIPVVPLHTGSSNTISVFAERALDQLWGIMAWRPACWSEIVSILRLLTPWASTTLTYVLCVLYFLYAVSFACCFKGSLSVQKKLCFLFWHMENTSYSVTTHIY